MKAAARRIHASSFSPGIAVLLEFFRQYHFTIDENEPEDHQIMQGNSLLESFRGEPLDDLDQPIRYGVRVLDTNQHELDLSTIGQIELTVEEASTAPARQNFAMLREGYYACHEPAEKARLRHAIDAAVLKAIDARLERRREQLENSLTIRRAEEAKKHRTNSHFTSPSAAQRKIDKDQSALGRRRFFQSRVCHYKHRGCGWRCSPDGASGFFLRSAPISSAWRRLVALRWWRNWARAKTTLPALGRWPKRSWKIFTVRTQGMTWRRARQGRIGRAR